MVDEQMNPGDQFEKLVEAQHYERVMPRLKDIRAQEENLSPSDILRLGECKEGQEITLEFYPSREEPEIEPIKIAVTKVNENSINGVASGGPKNGSIKR